METAYWVIIAFMGLLAITDLGVGVSNDAVNFLSAAVGSKAAKLKWILFVAALGVLIGASFSSGMMDIARHGIFNPNFFYFREVICIFLAVVISDVFLLDLFNSLGLPTSTTVSMVFELLGASFIVSLIKISTDCFPLVSELEGASPTMANLLNSDKALTMIISIFLSVAIAFIFGLIVQWISRLVFTFHYRYTMGKHIGWFGGMAVTSIMYFMLIKGLKGSALVTPEIQAWVGENTVMLLFGSFVVFTILMQLLHWMKVNVFKIIVLIGTFSLAMAFAGNDLVNFIGVTLAGLSSITDFASNAGGLSADEFVMTSLSTSAKTPWYFLVGAGMVMVIALCTSKKAKKVLQTSIDLTSQQNEENEMFGSSSIARNMVRSATNMIDGVARKVPQNVKDWVNSRFRPLEDRSEVIAFDLVRASVNLVLAGLLIAVGTSMKLPLSTTYVAFMVGMGSSLADRAWSRESAVYRVTGVVSVVGGWFVTAGAAFLLASIVASIMYFGGIIAMFVMIGVVAFLLVNSHIRYSKKQQQAKVDEKMELILKSDDKDVVWTALKEHTSETLDKVVSFSAETYKTLFEAFSKEELGPLKSSMIKAVVEKNILKKMRRSETQGFQRVDSSIALERSTWYHLSTNSGQQMLNTLIRIGEPMKEHTDNSFSPITEAYIQEFSPYCREVYHVLDDIAQMIRTNDYRNSEDVSQRAKDLKHKLAILRKEQTIRLHQKSGSLKMDFVYLNLIQESHELLSEVRNLLRGSIKLFSPYAPQVIDNENEQ